MTRAIQSLELLTNVTLENALNDWRRIRARQLAREGVNQADYTPTEVVLCLATMFVVDHHYWNTGKRRAETPSPVPELAALFRRPNTSLLSKMCNLDGSRPRGGRFDLLGAEALLANGAERLMQNYVTILQAARRSGIDEAMLPDFLSSVIGTDESVGRNSPEMLDIERAIEQDVQEERESLAAPPEVVERLRLSLARVSQGRFARQVLANYEKRCAFCGLEPGAQLHGRGLLVASHIKPWRHSTKREKYDVGNGVSACRNHDAAFDQGLLYLSDTLEIKSHPFLLQRILEQESFASAYGRPPISERLLLPPDAVAPSRVYLKWHRTRIADLDAWVISADLDPRSPTKRTPAVRVLR